jgi:hypothetical protein
MPEAAGGAGGAQELAVGLKLNGLALGFILSSVDDVYSERVVM